MIGGRSGEDQYQAHLSSAGSSAFDDLLKLDHSSGVVVLASRSLSSLATPTLQLGSCVDVSSALSPIQAVGDLRPLAVAVRKKGSPVRWRY